MLPLPHLGRHLGRDESAPREEPQHTDAHLALDGRDILMAERRRFVKVHGLCLGAEYPIGVDLLREHGVIANPLPFVLDAIEQTYALGMVPTLGALDVGFTRTMVLLVEAGKLRPPVFLKILLSGALAVGPFPTEEAIDFHLRQIPPGLDVEWVVVPMRSAILCSSSGSAGMRSRGAAGSGSASATTRPPSAGRRTPRWSSAPPAGSPSQAVRSHPPARFGVASACRAERIVFRLPAELARGVGRR